MVCSNPCKDSICLALIYDNDSAEEADILPYVGPDASTSEESIVKSSENVLKESCPTNSMPEAFKDWWRASWRSRSLGENGNPNNISIPIPSFPHRSGRREATTEELEKCTKEANTMNPRKAAPEEELLETSKKASDLAEVNYGACRAILAGNALSHTDAARTVERADTVWRCYRQ
jgi:hypothetical protein